MHRVLCCQVFDTRWYQAASVVTGKSKQKMSLAQPRRRQSGTMYLSAAFERLHLRAGLKDENVSNITPVSAETQQSLNLRASFEFADIETVPGEMHPQSSLPVRLPVMTGAPQTTQSDMSVKRNSPSE